MWNGAVFMPLIEEIDTAGGKMLYRRAPSAPIRVYDEGLDGTMIQMMKGVIEQIREQVQNIE